MPSSNSMTVCVSRRGKSRWHQASQCRDRLNKTCIGAAFHLVPSIINLTVMPTRFDTHAKRRSEAKRSEAKQMQCERCNAMRAMQCKAKRAKPSEAKRSKAKRSDAMPSEQSEAKIQKVDSEDCISCPTLLFVVAQRVVVACLLARWVVGTACLFGRLRAVKMFVEQNTLFESLICDAHSFAFVVRPSGPSHVILIRIHDG